MQLPNDRPSRILLSGAAIALAGGLAMGGAMRPDFGGDGRPRGPQQISRAGSTGPFDDGGAAGAGLRAGYQTAAYATPGYGGHVPDYVLGTDRLRGDPQVEERAAAPPPAERLALADAREDPYARGDDEDNDADLADAPRYPQAPDRRAPAQRPRIYAPVYGDGPPRPPRVIYRWSDEPPPGYGRYPSGAERPPPASYEREAPDRDDPDAG